MYATLKDFMKMSPEDQRKVTHLDLSIASDEDLYRARHQHYWNQLWEAPGEEDWPNDRK